MDFIKFYLFLITMALIDAFRLKRMPFETALKQKRFFLLPKYLLKMSPDNNIINNNNNVERPMKKLTSITNSEYQLPLSLSMRPQKYQQYAANNQLEQENNGPKIIEQRAERNFIQNENKGNKIPPASFFEVTSQPPRKTTTTTTNEQQQQQQMINHSGGSRGQFSSRQCYFSPVQCLLSPNREERIKHFVEFVMPVAAAVSPNNSTSLEKSDMENPEAISARIERASTIALSMLNAQELIVNQVAEIRKEKAEKAAAAAANANLQSTRNLYEKFSHRRFPISQRFLRPYLRNLGGATTNFIIPQQQSSNRGNSRW